MTWLLLALTVAAPPAGEVDELAALSEHARGIRTLQASMTQRKEITVLGDVVETRGTFAFARPRRLLIDLDGPGGTTLVIDGDRMTTLTKALARLDRVRLSEDPRAAGVAEHLFLLLDGDPSRLRETYRVEVRGRDPLRLRLTPRNEALQRFIASVETRLDPRGFVAQIKVHETIGDSTTWTFAEPVLNAPIPEERFRVDAP